MRSFSLRTLFLIVIIATLLCAWMADRYRFQRELQELHGVLKVEQSRSSISAKSFETRRDEIRRLAADRQNPNVPLLLYALSDPDRRIRNEARWALWRIGARNESQEIENILRWANSTGDVIPPWERWEISFTTESVEEYAQQLDFFDIELGVLGRSGVDITYASNLSDDQPKVRVGDRDEELRLYFLLPEQGKPNDLAHKLLSKNNVYSDQDNLVHFISEETMKPLARIEQSSFGNRSMATLRKTKFAVRPSGSGFEFYVVRHDFLSADTSKR